MSNCWKSHALAQTICSNFLIQGVKAAGSNAHGHGLGLWQYL